jgi:hypothetical protein
MAVLEELEDAFEIALIGDMEDYAVNVHLLVISEVGYAQLFQLLEKN